MTIKDAIKRARLHHGDTEEQAEAAATAKEADGTKLYAVEFAKLKDLSRGTMFSPVLDVEAHAGALKALAEWAVAQ